MKLVDSIPIIFVALGFSWLTWLMLSRKSDPKSKPKFKLWHLLWPPALVQHIDAINIRFGSGKQKINREKFLFVLFIVICLLAVMFDPFPKVR
jgi:hypothetical protein